jgi:hypothetical protein
MKYTRFASLISNTISEVAKHIAPQIADIENEQQNYIKKHPAYQKIKEGKYLYNNENSENYTFRAGDYQADNIKSIGLKLISEVVWINDLEYKLVLNHINKPNFTHLKVGDSLHARITEITDEYFVTETSFDEKPKTSKLWFAS